MEREDKPLTRTDGDGMENNPTILLPPKLNSIKRRSRKLSFSNKVIYRPAEHCRTQLHPSLPKSNPKYLTPKIVPRAKKTVTSLSYSKEPRFIPREPFKGAVTSILPRKIIKKPKIKDNNVDIQILVSQMSNLASSEMRKISVPSKTTEEVKDPSEVLADNQKLLAEIHSLKDTNEQLEKQLRFQTQVNTELKTLLVAAVGEDLEARVQLLTEDKLQLARALLSSAEHLSTHREQVEWLAGHCEVWRSKFLASSLMVDELARWKSVLSEHVGELQEAVKCLLEEHNELNVDIINIWDILQSIAVRCNVTYEKCESTLATHVVAVTNSCRDLSQRVAAYLLGPSFTALQSTKRAQNSTPGEQMAQKVLMRTSAVVDKQKFGSAYTALSKSAGQSGCVHCRGYTEHFE